MPRNHLIKVKFTEWEIREITKRTDREKFPNISSYVRFKIFYDHPVLNMRAWTRLAQLGEQKRYKELVKFIKEARRNGGAINGE